MKVLMIGNPVAGGGKAARRCQHLAAALGQRGCEVELYLTEKAGDGNRRAASTDATLDRIVVIGGDGTLNEVLNGLPDPSAVPLAQWPMGTANIMGHELRLPRKVEPLADMIHAGRTRRLDLGRINDRRFLLLASAGFDAMVTQEVAKRRSGRLGYRGYIVPIYQTLRQYQPPKLRVTVDGGESTEGALVVVSNTRNYGGLFSVTNRAECDSGHLDVCVFQSGRYADLMRYSVAALRRRVPDLTDVTYLTGKQIDIDSDQPVAVEVDGDYHGVTPCHITVQHAVVPIVVPAVASAVAAPKAAAL